MHFLYDLLIFTLCAVCLAGLYFLLKTILTPVNKDIREHANNKSIQHVPPTYPIFQFAKKNNLYYSETNNALLFDYSQAAGYDTETVKHLIRAEKITFNNEDKINGNDNHLQAIETHNKRVREHTGVNNNADDKIKEMFAKGIKVNLDVPLEDTFSKTVFADNVKLKLAVDYYTELAKYDNEERISPSQIQKFSAELKEQYHSGMPVEEINEQLTEIFDCIASGNSTKGTIELMGKVLKECLLL